MGQRHIRTLSHGLHMIFYFGPSAVFRAMAATRVRLLRMTLSSVDVIFDLSEFELQSVQIQSASQFRNNWQRNICGATKCESISSGVFHLVRLATQMRIYSIFSSPLFERTARSYTHWIVGNLFFHACLYISINDKCNKSAVGWWARVCVHWMRPVCLCMLECACVTFRMFQRTAIAYKVIQEQTESRHNNNSLVQTNNYGIFFRIAWERHRQKNINCKFINLWNHLNTWNGINENEVIWRFCFKMNIGGGGNWTVWIKISVR